ncbi:phosphatidylserine lipase ABHD16A-like [Aethina tumida]|uniref:phosphatidylserine lipase ABHD16A-like n=1 Tax=Aethina tumida TaxID=116153 RepID=UPI00214849B7|nr:phosphatidylserine lipase ABHD16A-like [Aethina tumida]
MFASEGYFLNLLFIFYLLLHSMQCNEWGSYVMETFRKWLAYVGLHTFGMKILYPGSCCFMPKILGLNSRRSELLAEHGCELRKLTTKEGNTIETIFLDARDQSKFGDVLVICCEGSASFFEDGCLIKVPIYAGYSMLGWNHPGFGNSTGKPMPSQVQNAIDAVLQYAIRSLGFKRKDILFYSWSIGAYPASWAAANYNECRGVVLDGAFDDIMELAKHSMPNWLHSIVEAAVNNYININISALLVNYPGPILIIRRTRDEIMCLDEDDLASNRANFLLIDILKHRYPYIITEKVINELSRYLSLTGMYQNNIVNRYKINDFECQLKLQNYVTEHTNAYPLKIGKDYSEKQKIHMALFLAGKYMIDFDANHCTPLPFEMFQEPWTLRLHP